MSISAEILRMCSKAGALEQEWNVPGAMEQEENGIGALEQAEKSIEAIIPENDEEYIEMHSIRHRSIAWAVKYYNDNHMVNDKRRRTERYRERLKLREMNLIENTYDNAFDFDNDYDGEEI